MILCPITDEALSMALNHKCLECGERPSISDARWRWNGFAYEHHHDYPVGHVLAVSDEQFERMIDEKVAEELTKHFENGRTYIVEEDKVTDITGEEDKR